MFRDTAKGKINDRVANGAAVVIMNQHDDVCKVEIPSIGLIGWAKSSNIRLGGPPLTTRRRAR